MLLRDIPVGATCFVDATIFYYHLVNSPPLSEDCSDFLERIEQGQVSAVTSTVAVSEAIHKIMLTQVVARHAVDRKGLISRLKRHPELLDDLTEHQRVFPILRSLDVEQITLDLLARAAEVSTQLRLLTNDALTVALMQKLGITNLATNDDDFDSVASLKVFKPLRV